MKKLDELNDSIDVFNAIVENMKWFDRVQQIVVDLVDQSKMLGDVIKREQEIFRKENDSLGREIKQAKSNLATMEKDQKLFQEILCNKIETFRKDVFLWTESQAKEMIEELERQINEFKGQLFADMLIENEKVQKVIKKQRDLLAAEKEKFDRIIKQVESGLEEMETSQRDFQVAMINQWDELRGEMLIKLDNKFKEIDASNQNFKIVLEQKIRESWLVLKRDVKNELSLYGEKLNNLSKDMLAVIFSIEKVRKNFVDNQQDMVVFNQNLQWTIKSLFIYWIIFCVVLSFIQISFILWWWNG